MTAACDAARPRTRGIPGPFRFGAAALRLALLPVLAACGDGPTAAGFDCTNVPVLLPGDSVPGVLDQRDGIFDGARIDYYGLRLESPGRVRVTLRSDTLDPLLLLFRTASQVQVQAFDTAGAPPDSTEVAVFERGLSRGCHLIGASSWETPGTGPYVIRADTLPPGPADDEEDEDDEDDEDDDGDDDTGA